jgi:hypothetical protein
LIAVTIKRSQDRDTFNVSIFGDETEKIAACANQLKAMISERHIQTSGDTFTLSWMAEDELENWFRWSKKNLKAIVIFHGRYL